MGTPLRVLFWTDWFLPSIGGVEVFSARLLPALARRGHEIVVVAGHHQAGLPDEIDWDGVTVRRFPFHPLLAAGNVDRLAATLRDVARLKQDLQPDLVHLNTLGPSVLFHLETSRRRPAPVLLTMHSPVMGDALRLDTLYGRALRSANWVNCNSNAVHADLCSCVPEFRERSSVTYYGMDAPALHPSVRPREHPVVLGFGRLVRDKGFDLALRAFHVVAQRLPRVRLVLAGDGAARPELEQLAADLGLSDAVRFLGAVAPDQVPHLLDSASLVVVPSRWNEPFGLVALEAALMARPVVAARVGGLAEAVEEGKTGLLVDPEDFVSLADAMLYLLENHEVADRMGATARERAGERFSWNRCVDEYESLYELTRHDRSAGGAP
jgi:glycogen(starch) synthase